MAPTSLLAGVVLCGPIGDPKNNERYWFFEIHHHWDKVIEAMALRYGGFFVTWFLGCFALATIASVVNRLESDDDGAAWIPDRHQRAREHLGAVFVAALITFCAFLAGNALSEFVQSAAIRW